ncbi:MAG: hypothetical protein CME61_08780 [Halobacteriovoraceae bacterium]|nr:hypothetical protein [Halobacteriovoraceae bacterium]OUX68083.1 MAG: hypothetical protein CBD38_00510 [bacterium TMED178]|tara:strand:+ start:459 stop:908 length:450 start_codon:yes stop_codon:yes gene_type:complete
MNEITHLKKMWKPRAKRSAKTIADPVSLKGLEGSLSNDHWAFNVTYAFRDALDIRYDMRVINKRKTPLWTQGPLIGFKDGDLIHTRDKHRAVQVRFAQPMGWDRDKNCMYTGSVVFTEFNIQEGRPTEIAQHTCTQMEFLELLISGQMP